MTTLSQKRGFDRAAVLLHWFRWHVCSRGPRPCTSFHMLSPICLPCNDGPTRIRTDRTARGRRPCSSIPDPPDGLRYAPSLEGGPLDGGRTDTQPSRPDTYRPDGTTEGGSSREPLRTAGANLCVPSPICARCRRHSGGASSYFAVTGKRASSLHVPRPRADQTITAAARNSNPPQNTPPARPAPTTAERQQSIPTAQAQARGRPTNPHCSFISRPSRGTKKCRPPSRSVLV